MEVVENVVREVKRPLASLAKACENLEQIRKSELRFGDLVGIWTENSVYAIGVAENGSFLVSGGWFDENGVSPKKVGINGCTFGGTAIKQDIIAARGLRLEFDNGVVTSPIRGFKLFTFGS